MPIGGTFSRADFPRLYAMRLAFMDKLIGPNDWPEVEKLWESLFNIESSSRLREEHLEYGGFGSFNTLEENEAVQYDQLVEGPRKTYTHALYGLGYQIGYLAAKHDLDGIIKKHAPELGRSCRMTIQTLAASFWNGIFATQTTADGLYYASASHTYVRGGGTWSNLATSNPVLGHSALETGLVAFQGQKDLMGNPMPLPYEKLLIPPALDPLAHELLKSNMRHDTTTHASSYLTGKLTPVVWPFLTSSTMWVILAPKQYTKIFWYWNIKPETDHGFDFDTSAAKTKTLFAGCFGATDARGSYCSSGAGA
jgi:hypothetical protein